MLNDSMIFSGACADQNRRKKMEDRYICIPNLNNLLQLEVKLFYNLNQLELKHVDQVFKLQHYTSGMIW